MTNGTSQGLMVVVAVVIFGIFVLIAYALFGGQLKTSLATIVDDSTQMSRMAKPETDVADLPRYDSSCSIDGSKDMPSGITSVQQVEELPKPFSWSNQEYKGLVRKGSETDGTKDVYGIYTIQSTDYAFSDEGLENTIKLNEERVSFIGVKKYVEHAIISKGFATEDELGESNWNPDITNTYLKHYRKFFNGWDYQALIDKFFNSYSTEFAYLNLTDSDIKQVKQNMQDAKDEFRKEYTQEQNQEEENIKKDPNYKLVEQDGSRVYKNEYAILQRMEDSDGKNTGFKGGFVVPDTINGVRIDNSYITPLYEFEYVYAPNLETIYSKNVYNVFDKTSSIKMFYAPNLKQITVTDQDSVDAYNTFKETHCLETPSLATPS